MSTTNQIDLEYYDGKNLMNPGDIRISASSIAKYITNTNEFWRELMLGEKSFTGSTASVLGTVVHGFAESFVRFGTVNGEQMEDYIDKQCGINTEVDGSIIREHYPTMGTKLINDYLLHNRPSFVEEFLMEELIPATPSHGAIYVGGSNDGIIVPGVTYTDGAVSTDLTGTYDQCTITDYKTTSATSLPDRIEYKHRLQLLTYAYLYSKRGIHTDRIRIIYVTRNNVGRVGKFNEKTKKYGVVKQYPTEVRVLTESITEQDYNYIEGMLSVISRSIRLWQEQPELRSVLAQDFRL